MFASAESPRFASLTKRSRTYHTLRRWKVARAVRGSLLPVS